MSALLPGRTSIITGAGGSLGRALARTATCLASDRAGAITAGIVDATCARVAG